jgi:hypothetical protein
MKLIEGKGNEGDTLKDKSIYVYDTKSFPFYPGEVKSVTPWRGCSRAPHWLYVLSHWFYFRRRKPA